MPKSMTPDELNSHVSSATARLSSLFSDWTSSGNKKLVDKAKLVAYWIKDYVSYLRREGTFSPKSVPRLKRGSVVVVDFGFRLGAEFGGRHFAVVVDNGNDWTSPIVTVVPMFSLKESYKPNAYTCKLKDGIYAPMIKKTSELVAKAMEITDEISSIPSDMKSSVEVKAKTDAAAEMATRAAVMLDEIEHMKEGSVANTCQITTISKMRIKRPLKKDDPLYGLRLSTEDMELINQQLSRLFLFPK